MSAKKVRLQLEATLECDLVDRKKEIDELVMDFVNAKTEAEEDSAEEENNESAEASEASEEEDTRKSNKRASASRNPPKKKRKQSSEDDYSEEEKPKKSKKKAGKAKKKGSGSDSGSEWEKPEPEKKKKGAGKGGYMRAYTLSPELAKIMEAEALPRHAVVKKVWAMIKERNLYDPKNKQFAICDDDLYAVMKVKRFRTFGMMKYLKDHFLADP
jgi:upstream activation factor subunit UAF30